MILALVALGKQIVLVYYGAASQPKYSDLHQCYYSV